MARMMAALRLPVLGGAADEALVDLDLVERRLLQIAERGIAGAEIVEREADADRLQLGEHVVGRFAFDQEHALGDLELELARLRARELASALIDGRGQARIDELDRREVDRDPDMLGPFRRLEAGGAQHPFADLRGSGRFPRRAG